MPDKLSSGARPLLGPIQEERDTDATRTGSLIDVTSPMAASRLKHALDKNPDQMADVHEIARNRGASPLVVEENYEEVKKRERLESFDGLKNPALAKFLSNQENADVSHDDIDALTELEDHLGAFAAGAVSLPEMVLKGAGAMIEVGGRTVERALPESLVTGIREIEGDMPAISEMFTALGGTIGEAGEAMAPEETSFTTDVAGALGQVSAQILTAIIAPAVSVPTMFAMGTEQMAERQKASGTYGESFTGDVALLAGGTVTAATEKLGLDKLLNRVPPEVRNAALRKLSDVAIGGGYEALTEVAEGIGHGLVEYATTNPDAEIFQGIAHEASVAGTAGAIVRALIPSYRGTAKSKQISKATDEIKTSIAEQEFIDQTLVLAQQSKTSERSARAFAEFVKGLPKNKEFKIDPAALEGLEVDLPVYVTEQLDGLGSDIKVSLDQITSDMVNDPKVMEAIRPHMRMSEGSMTISEMEAGQGETVRNLLEQAQQEVDAKQEADEVFDDVVSQLVATGRVSAANARVSATLIPAYVTTKAKETGLPVKEVYDRMGLSVEKIGGADDSRALTQLLKRQDMVTKLKDCLSSQ